MTIEFEVQPHSGAVLVFDGRVLEIFGYANIHRFHLWQQPRLEFIDGVRPRVLVRCAVGPYFETSMEPDSRPELLKLAAELESAIARREAGS